MKTLRKGDRNEDVRTLQKALNLYPDGIFGSLTEESVKQFQRSHSLTADGIVGAKTWQMIQAEGSRATTPGVAQQAATATIPVAPKATTALTLTKSKRTIKELIVHCTASREGQDLTVAQVRAMHKQQGWSDIGYHYLIYRDGTINLGRSVHISGAHCVNHNAHSIGICYVGGLASDAKTPKDTRTDAQKQSLIHLLTALKELYPAATIHGHREFANKACPSFDAQSEYANI